MTVVPAVVCAGATRCFGNRVAVDRVDLVVPTGTVLGLLGRNGAGKTTLLRLILGLLRPTAGSVQVLGAPALATGASFRARVGFLAEDHPVHAWMTVAGLAAHHRAFFPRFDQGVFSALRERAGLSPHSRLGALSRGQRASACLAATIAADPDLLVLDDPGLGLDPSARRDLLDGILATVRRPGRTVILSSHQMADIDRVADRIAVLAGGVLRADCTLDRFRATVRRLVLRFAGPPPDPELPGLLSWTVAGEEADAVLVTDTDPDAVARSLGACAVREVPLPLDDAFTAYTGPRGPRATLAATLAGMRATPVEGI